MSALAVSELYSRKEEIYGYIDGYWNENDVWTLDSEAFKSAGIDTQGIKGTLVDFRSFHSEQLKEEMKFYLLHELKEKRLSVRTIRSNYKTPVAEIGKNCSANSFDGLPFSSPVLVGKEKSLFYETVQRNVVRFITDFYDERSELERDRWHARMIPGVKISAAGKRTIPSLNFEEIPDYYRESVKRYLKTLIYRRSWSFCCEILIYIRYFYKVFYAHGYGDGFQEILSRSDIESYLQWVSEDYEKNNATFRSKAVSFIRNWLDFIQLAEFSTAPKKDITRLILEEDIPRRERAADTLEKVKYIPEPVKVKLDEAIDEIEPAKMKPVYILLRETGWRGTDILNLRYDQCLEFLWNSREEEYVPYLCGEITKTGIPMHKIPIRPEVAEMVNSLINAAKEKSTADNNPERYLFNTYEGKSKGLPYSKPAFATAVNELIARKEIRDGSGELYHFKTHALRHTRAMEYTEQGMPIGIIQQILGHCSLQMTLHYSKVSEDMLYKKWKDTEKLDMFKPEAAPPPNGKHQQTEEVQYEYVRKNLDAVRVPFGTCFKPSKIACKTQTEMCLECMNFCSTKEDLPAYDAEIKRVESLIFIAKETQRTDWAEKNQKYLENLVKVRERILQEGIVHKNGKNREEYHG